MSEKTHEPSSQRRREARKNGQVPRSRLLGSSSATFGALAGTLAFAPETAARCRTLAERALGLGSTRPEVALEQALEVLALGVLPTLVGAFVAALVAGLATAGLELNVAQVAPKLDRVDPFQGAKKLVSPSNLLELVKGLVVALVLGTLAWSDVREIAPVALRAVGAAGGDAFIALLALGRPLLVKLSVVLLLLGLVDAWLARRKLHRELMMSHDEVKREHKSSEGDPHHKAKRKALHKQLSQGGPARGVHNATAVVVNPTHIAVALRFVEDECEAPYIVARGREEDALALRKHAQSLGIPIVKDIPLARSLVHYDVGEEVPEELYKAAAAVLKVALDESLDEDARLSRETP